MTADGVARVELALAATGCTVTLWAEFSAFRYLAVSAATRSPPAVAAGGLAVEPMTCPRTPIEAARARRPRVWPVLVGELGSRRAEAFRYSRHPGNSGVMARRNPQPAPPTTACTARRIREATSARTAARRARGTARLRRRSRAGHSSRSAPRARSRRWPGRRSSDRAAQAGRFPRQPHNGEDDDQPVNPPANRLRALLDLAAEVILMLVAYEYALRLATRVGLLLIGDAYLARRCARPGELRARTSSGGSSPTLREHLVLADGERGILVAPVATLVVSCLDGEAVLSTVIGGAGHYSITLAGALSAARLHGAWRLPDDRSLDLPICRAATT